MATNQNTAEHKVKLGAQGPEVRKLALGCMGMSGMYGASDEAEGVRTIHEAIERGVNLLDTGDFYGMGHNELLIRKAIEGRRDKVLLSVKFGGMRSPDGAFIGMDMRPEAIKNFVSYSLVRLGVETIDIYRPARLDPRVPIEETVGTIKELIQKGYVRNIGLSEVGVETVKRALAVHPITDLQIEYSLVTRKPEDAIFPALRALGVSATLYGVLSRGLLSGSKIGQQDFRNFLPRFTGENREKNQLLVQKIADYAAQRSMTSATLLTAYVLAKQPEFVTLAGARTTAQLRDALAALERPLTAAEVKELETLVPRDAIAGTRYDATQMAHLDSEK
jgi:aryl-alcohol dehydrogenase-like predicted oxidoreductase